MLIADDLAKLLEILPLSLKKTLGQHKKSTKLIEIVMDLGRRPEARFPEGPEYLSNRVITWHDLDYSIKRIGNFSGDNRAGIERTLHRISSIRNRQGSIIGLTCRVGRAVFGTINIIRDLLETNESILLLGKPGVGKTTAIREIARVLADEMKKRVVIIDTSNEIAGDGDIPHPAIGRARRMQVAKPELQHQVMIEAIENHMPQVIIIDEIGTELESLAARTIAERGVQLVGTAHGNYLDSLIKNPTLSDLIGGIQYVTLGDDEAKRRGTQKSILERKAAPAFQIAIEIHERTNWVIHEKVDDTVDQILQGSYHYVQRRILMPNGIINIYCEEMIQEFGTNQLKLKTSKSLTGIKDNHNNLDLDNYKLIHNNTNFVLSKNMGYLNVNSSDNLVSHLNKILSIYIYALSFQQIESIIRILNLRLVIVKEINKADVILALRSNIKQNTKLRQIAHNRHITIYTIHSNTIPQITRALKKILDINSVSPIRWSELCLDKTREEIEALNETKWAIKKIVLAKKQPVELLCRLANLRRIQHLLVKFYTLQARSFGEEPYRRLRIYPG
jgi:stage III sporulation protein SpoIIIAA